MWWFLVLVFCCQVISQPVTDELSRQPREIIECCPCPSRGDDTLGRSSQIGFESLVDCPCRSRSADSEGASSILFPSSVHPDGLHIRLHNSKEEQKNLLEPEVGLATSMLQTLREVTEEEYQDALARDAARSAGSDGTAEESAKNLVIIVNPRTSDDDRDVLAEASHVQESRCLHPLSSPPLARMRTLSTGSELLPDLHKLPKLKRPVFSPRKLLDLDSSVGASQVEEKVFPLNGGVPVTKSPISLFRSNSPFKSKLFSKNNEDLHDDPGPVTKSNVSPFRSNMPFKSKLFTKNDEDSESKNGMLTLKSPLFSNPKIKPILDGLKLPHVPKIKDASALQTGSDLSPAPSTVREVLEETDKKLSGLSRFAKRPVLLKNLLKLKDVELIPKTVSDKLPKTLKLPKTTVPMLRNTNTKDDLSENASVETREENDSQIKPNFELKSVKVEDNFSKANDENCTSDVNIINNKQNEDLLRSPSNTFSLTTNDMANFSQERDVSSTTDIDSLALVNFSKTTEDQISNVNENCQDSVEPKFIADIVPNDNNLQIDSIGDETPENKDNISLFNDDFTSRENPFDQDSVTDSSNVNNVISEPQSNLEDSIIDQISDDKSALQETINPVSDKSLPTKILKPIPTLSETLSAIRNNIQKLDYFINPTKTLTSKEIDDDIAKYEEKEKDSVDNYEFESENNELNNITTNEEQSKSLDSADSQESNTITMEDLQKLSDDLLESSSNQEQQKTSSQSEINNKQPDSQPVEQDIQEDDSENIMADTLTTTQEQKDRPEENLKENACPNDSGLTSVQDNEETPKMKSVDQETDTSEMKAEASDSIISTLPNILDPLNLSDKLKTLPFQNNIVQPSLPIDPLNLLNNPLNNVIDLNPKLPTLDDLRDQLSNVFNTNERADNDSQEECDYDEKEIEKMALEPSTTNTQIKLPTLKPSETSKDLFGTVKAAHPQFLGNNQKLNLNSYKAKVPVPKSLDLKPIDLESPRRSKDSALKTSLKLKPDRRQIVRSKLQSRKFPNNSNLLGDPAMNLPTLDQIKDALQASPSKLIGNPLQSNLNLFRSNPVTDLSDNIRLNAEKTMKGLQKKMQTALRGSQISEPLAKPQEFLEDVSDKLKAIHYDLNDRLASVHDNILDTSKLQLPTSLLRTPDNIIDRNLKTNLLIAKPKPIRLHSLASTLSSRDVDAPKIKTNARNSLESQVKTKKPSKVFRNQDFAASAPTPVRLAKPNFGKDHERDLVGIQQRLSGRTLSSEPKPKPSLPKPVFRKPNFKDSRVTISFGSTTPSISRSNDFPVTNPPPRMDSFDASKLKGKTLESRGLSDDSSRKSENLEQRPLQSKATLLPVQFASKSKESDILEKQNAQKLKTPTFSLSSLPRNNANKVKSLSDVVKERLSKFDSFKQGKVPKHVPNSTIIPRVDTNAQNNKTSPNPDMLRSASENTEVIVRQEPLKENVSYKCRLVCTQE